MSSSEGCCCASEEEGCSDGLGDSDGFGSSLGDAAASEYHRGDSLVLVGRRAGRRAKVVNGRGGMMDDVGGILGAICLDALKRLL